MFYFIILLKKIHILKMLSCFNPTQLWVKYGQTQPLGYIFFIRFLTQLWVKYGQTQKLG